MGRSADVGWRTPHADAHEEWERQHGRLAAEPKVNKGGRQLVPICSRAIVQAIEEVRSKGYEAQVFLLQSASECYHRPWLEAIAKEELRPYLSDGTIKICPSNASDDNFLLRCARLQEQTAQVTVLSNDRFEREVRAGVITTEWRNEHALTYMWYNHDGTLSLSFEHDP